MDVRDSFSAPGIFDSLAKSPDIASKTKEKLEELSTLSTNLFTHLDQADIDKDAVLLQICTITSNWRSLIRENSEEIGSDINRLKLFHAFENILDKVKVVIVQRQVDARTQAEEEAHLAKQEEGWVSWVAKGVAQGVAWTAATTANVSIGVLNKAANYVLPDSYQNWITDKKDQFIEYSMELLKGKDGSVTFEHILEGVENWQKFVKESHTPIETDVRITSLQDQVTHQLDSPESIASEGAQLSPQQKAEMRDFLTGVGDQHSELVQEAQEWAGMLDFNLTGIFAEAGFPFDPAVEKSIMEKAQASIHDAVEKGAGVLDALREGIQMAVSDSLSQIADAGIDKFTQATKYQALESVNTRYQAAVAAVNQQAETLILGIAQKMANAGESVREQGASAIEAIRAQQEAITNALTEKVTHVRDYLGQMAGDVVDRAVDIAVDKKNRYIVSSYAPEAVMKEMTFTKLVDDYVWYWLPTELRPGTKGLESKLTTHLKTNLGIILQDQNLQRLGVAALKGTENLLVALHNKEGKTDKEILTDLYKIEGKNPGGKRSASLQIPSLTLENYKAKVEENVAKRLGRLAANPKDGKGLFNFIKNKYYEFKVKIMGTTIHLVFKHYKVLPYLISLVKDDPKAVKELGLLSKAKGAMKNYAIQKLGLDKILKIFSQQSDIAFYYLIDKMTEEMDNILNPAKKEERKTTPPSEEQEVASLRKAAKDFTNSQNPIIPEALKVELGPLMQLIEKQGDSRNFKDMTAPLAELLPKWREWVKT